VIDFLDFSLELFYFDFCSQKNGKLKKWLKNLKNFKTGTKELQMKVERKKNV